MFHVIRDVKQQNAAPFANPVAGSTENTIFDALLLAEMYATEHARDIVVDRPIRFGDGFMFWTSNGSRVIYRAEEVK